MNINKETVIEALKTVYDPEIPVNIWELGLVYDIDVQSDAIVLQMTFTSPTCPMMDELLAQVKSVVGDAANIPVTVNLVWDPPWDISRMSDRAKIELDLTGMGW